jgi:hypothetical protein
VIYPTFGLIDRVNPIKISVLKKSLFCRKHRDGNELGSFQHIPSWCVDDQARLGVMGALRCAGTPTEVTSRDITGL